MEWRTALPVRGRDVRLGLQESWKRVSNKNQNDVETREETFDTRLVAVEGRPVQWRAQGEGRGAERGARFNEERHNGGRAE